MLNQYLSETQALLQNPNAPSSLYSTASLTANINTARGQVAGESESIRAIGTLTLTAGVQVYPFSAINFGSPPGVSGIQGAINARTAWVGVGAGQIWLRPRPFEWLSLYELNNPNPSQAQPQVWSQYGQGVNGTIYFSKVPDQQYTVQLDCVCYPIALATDSTVEAIPYLWTDAVPYFAAYLALLGAQASNRQADAQRMFQLYQEFVNRARRFANPSVLPYQYPQSGSPVRANQLGISPPSGGGNA